MATISAHDLNQFSGSENWYRHWIGKLVFTDGVHYLMANGAGWLVDAIASYQGDKRVKKNKMLQDFQLWVFKLNPDQRSGVLALFEDSGQPPVLTQNIEYTDFPLPEIKLYVEMGSIDGVNPARVMMLPSER